MLGSTYLGTKDIDVLITGATLLHRLQQEQGRIFTLFAMHVCEVHDFETRDDMLKCIGHILKTGDILIRHLMVWNLQSCRGCKNN